MVSTENKIFGVVGVLVIVAALTVYAIEYASMGEITMVSVKSAATTELTTTTVTPTTVIHTTTNPTTRLTTTLMQSTTTYLTVTTTTPTTSTTLPEKIDYLSKYRNKGFRQAYMNITFLCPSCVPAVAGNLRNEPGVMAKSMSYRQRVTWIIYDPTRVELERVYQLATANGDGILLNDTEI